MQINGKSKTFHLMTLYLKTKHNAKKKRKKKKEQSSMRQRQHKN